MESGKANQIWQAALGHLQLQVPRSVFDTWLRNTRAASLEEGIILIEAPTAFAVEWLEKRLLQMVTRVVRKVAKEGLEVRFQMAQSGYYPGHRNNKKHSEVPPSQLGLPLNQQFTFDTFITGPSNHLAFSAAYSIAETSGPVFNPLFIYAAAGLGKTHLIHAIAHRYVQIGATTCYLTSEQFTNEFIHGIRSRTIRELRHRYCSADAFLIDDIQFLAGKEQTQEGFFHTFNDLQIKNKQVVVTSDRPPKALALLHDRLRSRFQSGLAVDIKAPSLETRLAILKSKAGHMGSIVTEPVLLEIAKRASNNVRELEGALNKVVALSRWQDRPLTPDTTMLALEALLPEARKPQMAAEEVILVVAKHFDITPSEINGHTRAKHVVTARHIAMVLLHMDLGMGVSQIGRMVGNRDHSTVLHAIKKAKEEEANGGEVAQGVRRIKEEIGL